ncbi:MAG: peptide chain release factor N(5)-glutamine methyltransferase [Cyanobacteria bacterium SIG31]|nr:peptide chain release factor N(5)-glutamine methyltransferase [Cyanobacteria bacterium SIG31]
MSIQNFSKILINAGIEENEANYEIKMLLEHFCNYTEIDKLKGRELSLEELNLIQEKVKLRAEKRIPIQHIIGQAWFMGEYFKVTSDVLIPRDETEILVQKAIDIINENEFEDVLDIGTGSGCIACTIAKNTNATVLGVDISSDALRIALDNVTKLGINNKAIFRKSDLFEKIRDGEIFDIIISNPPYIPFGTVLEPELAYEPQMALFAGEDGIKIYRQIIEKAPEFLTEKGYLMFELGINESQKVKLLMEKDFENIFIEKDLAGIDRIIWGQKKK